MRNWIDDMERSCAMITIADDDKYFNSALKYLQTQEAIRLKIPIYIMIRAGTKVPEGWFDGAASVECFEWKYIQQAVTKIEDVMKELNTHIYTLHGASS